MRSSRRLSTIAIIGIVLSIVLTAGSVPSWGQDWPNVNRDNANQGRVGIISGSLGGTYVKFAAELANVLDDGVNVRVVPMMGKGSVQNIFDIAYLEGVDIGIVQSDVLGFIRQDPNLRNIHNTIRYITKLYNEEVGLLARKDRGSLADLKGGTVNFGKRGSGTEMTAGIVFDAAGVSVKPVNLPQPEALMQLKDGRIDALVYVAGKPVELFKDPSIGEYAHFIEVPHTEAWSRKSYLPGNFTARDYPGIVPEGTSVDTIAVGAIMAVYNWAPDTERYRRTANFVRAFFSKFDEFRRPPRHPKWKEVFLETKVGGWKRFQPAAELLAKRSSQPTGSEAPEDLCLKSFEAFDRLCLSPKGMGDLPLATKRRIYRDKRVLHGLE